MEPAQTSKSKKVLSPRMTNPADLTQFVFVSLQSLLTLMTQRRAFGDVHVTPVAQSFVSISAAVIVKRWQPEVG